MLRARSRSPDKVGEIFAELPRIQIAHPRRELQRGLCGPVLGGQKDGDEEFVRLLSPDFSNRLQKAGNFLENLR